MFRSTATIIALFYIKCAICWFSSEIFHFMTSKVVHDDRNGDFACVFFHCEVIVSSLAKFVGLQSRQKKDPFFHRHQEHGSRHANVVQHDRSDNISHTTYLFRQRKSLADVSSK